MKVMNYIALCALIIGTGELCAMEQVDLIRVETNGAQWDAHKTLLLCSPVIAAVYEQTPKGEPIVLSGISEQELSTILSTLFKYEQMQNKLRNEPSSSSTTHFNKIGHELFEQDPKVKSEEVLGALRKAKEFKYETAHKILTVLYLKVRSNLDDIRKLPDDIAFDIGRAHFLRKKEDLAQGKFFYDIMLQELTEHGQLPEVKFIGYDPDYVFASENEPPQSKWMRYSADFSELHLGTLQGLLQVPKIEWISSLNLAHNRLQQLPEGLGVLIHLREIDLSYNKMQLIAHMFSKAGLTKLHSLSLAHNRLREVPEQSVSELAELKELDLSYNFLTQLPRDMPKNLEELHMQENPINPHLATQYVPQPCVPISPGCAII